MSTVRKPERLHEVADFYDYLKHLTTLSTGSVVVLVTFAEKFTKAPKWNFLFGVSLSFFLASVVFSLVCMLFVLSARRYEDHEPDWENNIIISTFLLTGFCLIIGVLSLTIFGILNAV
jgi:heme/copper-type cytochrome/quinol oxidase subunit 2